jgi:hypothetical protein
LDKSLPKKIWFLWLQGIASAPLLVRNCYASWVKQNPGWDVILLDENNISVYLPAIHRGATKQALSDILRINLLADLGGVWVDATCFCTEPLDDWLADKMTTGFFAFDRPGPDRMISSWFLAAERDNYIAKVYQAKVNNYWQQNPHLSYITESKWRWINKHLEKIGRSIWFGTIATKILKVHPYFWFHFLFEYIYLRDKTFRELWDATSKISADIPHTVLFAGLYQPLNNDIKTHIDLKMSPLYKLTWKQEAPADAKGTIADYLFSR